MKQKGFLLVGILIIVIAAALLSLHVLDQAILDQRISTGFVGEVQMDAAAQQALAQAEHHPAEKLDTWVEVDTSIPGITAQYQCQPLEGNLLLIQSRAGTANNPSQILWQAYWNGVEQSRRRVQ